MFSFGGFSSLLPYIGYLSVMWVCILIGASAQVNQLLGRTNRPENKVEISLNDLSQYPEVACFAFNTIKKEKTATSLFAAFSFLRYNPEQSFKHPYTEPGITPLLNPVLNLQTLRAPPQLS